jgi:hypothetical protein
MQRALPARSVRPGPLKPAGFGRFTVPILWTLHGWLAMFFLAAGYAKLTEDLTLLTLLMGWPGQAGLGVVRTVGWIEVGLAMPLIAALTSERWGRIAAVGATCLLTLNTVALTVWHAARLEVGPSATNLILTGLGLAILIGHRRTPLSLSPKPRRKAAR